MIVAGDEVGNSQGVGNNNAYCQDNRSPLADCRALTTPFLTFCQKMIAAKGSSRTSPGALSDRRHRRG